jgi:L-asparagine transporter-like permease
MFGSKFPYLKITFLFISVIMNVYSLDFFCCFEFVYGLIMVLIICKILSDWLTDLVNILGKVSLYFR